MFTITSRVRTAVAVLAASGAALATGPIVSAAHAQPNTGGSGGSSDKCELLGSLFDSDVNAADDADKAGDAATRDEYLSRAENDLKYAQNAGCDWARVLLRNRYTATIAVSGGRLQLR